MWCGWLVLGVEWGGEGVLGLGAEFGGCVVVVWDLVGWLGHGVIWEGLLVWGF